MLVLSRKCGQKIVIGGNIVITVLSRRGDDIKLGIDAPGQVSINREEVHRRIRNDGADPHDAEPHESVATC